MEDMTSDEFRTILELVLTIVKKSKDKEEILQSLEALTILHSKQNQ